MTPVEKLAFDFIDTVLDDIKAELVDELFNEGIATRRESIEHECYYFNELRDRIVLLRDAKYFKQENSDD